MMTDYDYFDDDDDENGEPDYSTLDESNYPGWLWGEDDDELPEAYYAQWNPAVNPPAWYQCRACNGMGHDPYSMPCETCNATGVRYRLVYDLRAAWSRITFRFSHMKRLRRCDVCGKVYISTCDFCPDPACPNSFPF